MTSLSEQLFVSLERVGFIYYNTQMPMQSSTVLRVRMRKYVNNQKKKGNCNSYRRVRATCSHVFLYEILSNLCENKFIFTREGPSTILYIVMFHRLWIEAPFDLDFARNLIKGFTIPPGSINNTVVQVNRLSLKSKKI